MASSASKPKGEVSKSATAERGAAGVVKKRSARKTSPELQSGLIGHIRIAAGENLSPQTRLKIGGLNVETSGRSVEKEKVSLTLDRTLVHEIRTEFGGAAFSSTVNGLLYVALDRLRLSQLLEEMEREQGEASPEAYDRIIGLWQSK
jgi:hypothetical protein